MKIVNVQKIKVAIVKRKINVILEEITIHWPLILAEKAATLLHKSVCLHLNFIWVSIEKVI